MDKRLEEIRADFPVISGQKDLIYLDNAATTQKPQQVIDRITSFYTNENATVHRGVYKLSQEATDACDQVRRQRRLFLHQRKMWSLFVVQLKQLI